MNIERLGPAGLALITTRAFTDLRGSFRETFRAAWLEELAPGLSWVQDNESRSTTPGTVRGLHMQVAPFAQAKLVRVVRGSILDVAVDVRHGSPTFGKYLSVELDAEKGQQLFLPAGFLHGFVTRTPDTIVNYKVSAYYDTASERAVRFDDPDLAIAWGIGPADALLSDKDRAAPSFRQFRAAMKPEGSA